MRKYLIASALFCLLSCKQEDKTESKEIAIRDVLVLNTPSDYKFVEGKGADSYIAYLISKAQDTLTISYGEKRVINSLYYEPVPVLLPSERERVVKNFGRDPNPDEVLFSEFAEDDNKQRIFEKSFFMYDTINGILTKIVQPKRVGDGITGLNIPKLKNGLSLTIRGDNLDSLANQEALQIFKTIRYK